MLKVAKARQFFGDHFGTDVPRVTDPQRVGVLGRKLECHFFGYSYVLDNYTMDKIGPFYRGLHLSFEESVLMAKLGLPEGWNTTKCPGWIGGFYRLVRHALKAELRRLPDKGIPLTRQMGRLEFYPALGMPLDIIYGADGFFTFAGEVVTIDVTVNPEKCSTLSGPVVISIAPFSRRTNQKFRINLAWTLAREVARRLIRDLVNTHQRMMFKNAA